MFVNVVSFKNNDWIFPFRFDFSIKTECYCKYPPWMVLLSSRLRMCFEHLRFLYNKYRSWHLIHHYKSNILLSGKVNIWNLSEPLYLFSENLLYTSVSRCCRFVHLSFDKTRQKSSFWLDGNKLIHLFCGLSQLADCLHFMKNSRVVFNNFPIEKILWSLKTHNKELFIFCRYFWRFVTLILHFTFK